MSTGSSDFNEIEFDSLQFDSEAANSTIFIEITKAISRIAQILHEVNPADARRILLALDPLLLIDLSEPGATWPSTMDEKVRWLLDLQQHQVWALSSAAHDLSHEGRDALSMAAPIALFYFSLGCLLPLASQEDIYDAWWTELRSLGL